MWWDITSHADEQPTHLKSYPCNCCITSGAILRISKQEMSRITSTLFNSSSRLNIHAIILALDQETTEPQNIKAHKWGIEGYQQGVPTNVFLERCLSPVSNMQAETPKSANLTVPLESIKIFPACKNKACKCLYPEKEKITSQHLCPG